jgi:hypothetical protein
LSSGKITFLRFFSRGGAEDTEERKYELTLCSLRALRDDFKIIVVNLSPLRKEEK